jgi:hypothetical protein
MSSGSSSYFIGVLCCMLKFVGKYSCLMGNLKILFDVVGCWLLVLVVGCWLLVVGCWLLAKTMTLTMTLTKTKTFQL